MPTTHDFLQLRDELDRVRSDHERIMQVLRRSCASLLGGKKDEATQLIVQELQMRGFIVK